MRVNKKEFSQAMSYIASVNTEDLESLDLSEFFDTESEEFKKRIKEWKFIGLSNKDFITMNYDIWLDEIKGK